MNSLRDIKDIHKGKTAYLLGSGYSLNNYDLEKVTNNGIIFACNSSVVSLNKCDYFCMTDGGVPTSNYYNHGVSISKNVLLMNPELEYVMTDKSLIFDRRYSDRDNNKFDYNLLICGVDVCNVAVHMAWAMGCSDIYTIGCDLNWRDGYKYAKKWNDEKIGLQCYKEGPDIHLKNGIDGHLESSYNIWLKIKQSNPDVNIINTNPKGRLSEIFKTVIL